MASYCITAANHNNQNNHCASSFKLWKFDTTINLWIEVGAKPLNHISELLAAGHSVHSAKLDKDGDNITLGAPVEIELRIAKNETNYKISEMPTFK